MTAIAVGRHADLREAQLAMEKARLDLAVLLFQDFNENFNLVDDLDLAPPLMSFDDFAQLCGVNVPPPIPNGHSKYLKR